MLEEIINNYFNQENGIEIKTKTLEETKIFEIIKNFEWVKYNSTYYTTFKDYSIEVYKLENFLGEVFYGLSIKNGGKIIFTVGNGNSKIKDIYNFLEKKNGKRDSRNSIHL